MRDHRILATLVMLPVVLATGCGTQTVTPGGGTEPAPTASGSEPQLPPRPREVRVDNVDPCTLITPDQQQQLGIDSTPRPGGGSSRGEPACSFGHAKSEPFFSFNLVTVPFEGAEAWLTRSGEVRIVDVAGFGAVETASGATGAAGDCIVSVDIADGQYLGVLFVGDGAGSFTPDEMCERARLAAAAATRTLLAR